MSEHKTIIAFDPGSEKTRYAVIAGNRHMQYFVSSGTIENKPDEFCRIFSEFAHGYAIETIGKYPPKPQVVMSLLQTAQVAGMLLGMAHATKKPVFAMPANAPISKPSWRVLLCGARDGARADDEMVKAYLQMVLRDLPKRCNVHERDAAAIGTVALRCGMQVPEGRA